MRLSSLVLAAATAVASMASAAGIMNDNLYPVNGSNTPISGTLQTSWWDPPQTQYFGSSFGFIAKQGGIQITALGVFDNEGDGIKDEHQVTLFHTLTWNQQHYDGETRHKPSNTTDPVVSINTVGKTPDFWAGKFAYFNLPSPVTLTAGDAYIVGTAQRMGLRQDPFWWLKATGEHFTGTPTLFDAAAAPNGFNGDIIRWRDQGLDDTMDFTKGTMSAAYMANITDFPFGPGARESNDNPNEWIIMGNAYAVVPEPTSLAGIALGAVALLRRRSRQ